MPKIKEILGQEKEIWVDVNEGNYRAFFMQVKQEGFVWLNGKEIEPQKEQFRFCISVTSQGQIGGVNGYARFGAGEKPKICTFQL